MGEIMPKWWRFWRIFDAQMAKTAKEILGTLGVSQKLKAECWAACRRPLAAVAAASDIGRGHS